MKKSNRPWHLYLIGTLALALGSCSGGAGGPRYAALPAAAPPLAAARSVAPNALSEVVTAPGKVDGIDNEYNPVDGDAPNGGHGQVVDKIHCRPTMTQNLYHVHIFLGVVYNGNLIAVPDTIGMKDPGQEINGFVNSASCFYAIHTHDASGIVHVELDENLPKSDAFIPLKKLFDIWGVARGKNSFGPFKGNEHVFIGMPPALGQTVVSSYHRYTGNIDDIKIASHEVIWIEIGKPWYDALQLPPVKFYLEY